MLPRGRPESLRRAPAPVGVGELGGEPSELVLGLRHPTLLGIHVGQPEQRLGHHQGARVLLQQGFEPLARSRSVEFRIESGSADVLLTGNRKALTGALTNLIENAFQAVESGGCVTLAARRSERQLLLVVRDDGRGMSASVVAKLFEPFFTTRSEGTGLGLAIARGVARAHGGSIEVKSEPGTGTEFVIFLPLVESP